MQFIKQDLVRIISVTQLITLFDLGSVKTECVNVSFNPVEFMDLLFGDINMVCTGNFPAFSPVIQLELFYKQYLSEGKTIFDFIEEYGTPEAKEAFNEKREIYGDEVTNFKYFLSREFILVEKHAG